MGASSDNSFNGMHMQTLRHIHRTREVGPFATPYGPLCTVAWVVVATLGSLHLLHDVRLVVPHALQLLCGVCCCSCKHILDQLVLVKEPFLHATPRLADGHIKSPEKREVVHIHVRALRWLCAHLNARRERLSDCVHARDHALARVGLGSILLHYHISDPGATVVILSMVQILHEDTIKERMPSDGGTISLDDLKLADMHKCLGLIVHDGD